MDAPVVAAAVTGVVALVVAIWTALWTSRLQSRLAREKSIADERIAAFNAASAQRLKDLEGVAARALEGHRHELLQAAKRQDQRTEQQAVLDQYRKPLLAAADDLGHRIDNIRLQHFFDRYLVDQDRQQMALRTTLFRFAKYFGWIEVLNQRVIYLDFENEAETRAVAAALRDVGRAFATDDPDTQLMLWREEQRAIGGLMQRPGDPPGVIGYETFEQLFDERIAAWFARFAEDMQREGAKSHPRLIQLQEHLAALVFELDQAGLHGPTTSPWLGSSAVYQSRAARSARSTTGAGTA